MAARQLTTRLLAQLGPAKPALPCVLPASLQLAAWLSTASAPPSLGHDEAAELAKALRTQQLFETTVEPLRALHGSLPLAQLLDHAQQQ